MFGSGLLFVFILRSGLSCVLILGSGPSFLLILGYWPSLVFISGSGTLFFDFSILTVFSFFQANLQLGSTYLSTGKNLNKAMNAIE